MKPGREDRDWDSDQLKRRLQAMDNYEFEHLIGDLWEKQGWTSEVEQQSADAGVDVRATQSSPYRRKVLIQAKRYSDDNPVNGPDVQQYAALKQQEPDTDESIIVTTGRFTGSAEDRAKDLNVKLIDGDGLVGLIDRLDAYELVEEYIGQPAVHRRKAQERDQNRQKTHNTRNGVFQRLTSEEQREVEDAVGKDLEECVRDEQYQATRAMERARTVIELNPHDAKELGVFEGADLYDFERKFEDKKIQLVFLKEDIHVNDDGELYVADLTEYIKPAAIEGSESSGVVGVIKRGVKDGAWLSEEGEEHWKTQKQLRRFKKTGKRVLSSVLNDAGSNAKDTISSESEPATPTSETQQTPSEPKKSEGTVTAKERTASASQSRPAENEESPPENAEVRSEKSVRSSDDSTNSKTETTPRTGDGGTGQRVQGEATTEQRSIPTGSSGLDLSRSKWFYGVTVGTGGWALVWLLLVLLPDAGAVIGGLAVLLSWPLLPVAILMDTRETGKFDVTRAKSLIYTISSAVPLFAVIPGVVYLYRRENAWGQ